MVGVNVKISDVRSFKRGHVPSQFWVSLQAFEAFMRLETSLMGQHERAGEESRAFTSVVADGDSAAGCKVFRQGSSQDAWNRPTLSCVKRCAFTTALHSSSLDIVDRHDHAPVGSRDGRSSE